MLAPETRCEGCEPVQSSSPPSLWTAEPGQPQEAGAVLGARDTAAQQGRAGSKGVSPAMLQRKKKKSEMWQVSLFPEHEKRGFIFGGWLYAFQSTFNYGNFQMY